MKAKAHSRHPVLLHYVSVVREEIASMGGISYTLHWCETLKHRLQPQLQKKAKYV